MLQSIGYSKHNKIAITNITINGMLEDQVQCQLLKLKRNQTRLRPNIEAIQQLRKQNLSTPTQ